MAYINFPTMIRKMWSGGEVQDWLDTALAGQVLVTVDDLKLLLSFAPEDVPKGLDPTFYHTLTYEGDTKLQAGINRIKSKLSEKKE